MADGLFNIKVKDTSLSARHSAASATSCDLSTEKMEVCFTLTVGKSKDVALENKVTLREEGGASDTEIGLKEVKLEQADTTPEDVMTSSGQFVDSSVPTKEENFGICFDWVKKIKMEKGLVSEEGDGTNNLEIGMREIKEEETNASSGDLTSSTEGVLSCSLHSDQLVDTSVLTKEEDLGMFKEEEEERSAQADSDSCVSFTDNRDAWCDDRVLPKLEMKQRSEKFCEIQGSSQEPVFLSIVDSERTICECDESDSLQGDPLMLSSEKSYCCTKCTASFPQKWRLKRHKVSHVNDKPFSCPHCPSKFNNKSNLNRHAIIHSNERPFRCVQCLATFTQSASLNRHLLIHSNDKPYLCAHCPVRFISKWNLQMHLAVHSSEKPFICKLCPARFTQKRRLKKHLAVHSREKPYLCPHCPTRFTRKDNLKYHLTTHLNEKPYVCAHCPARFNQKLNLRRHLAVHSNEKPYSCPHCSSEFKFRSSLSRHMAAHSNNSSFSCSHCLSSYKDKKTLKAHLLIHSEEKQLSFVNIAPLSCSGTKDFLHC